MKKVLMFEDVFGLFGGIEKVITNVVSCCNKDDFNISLYCNNMISDEYLQLLKSNNVEIYQAQKEYISNPIKRHINGYSLFRDFLKNHSFDVIHFNVSNAIDVKYAKIAKKMKIKNIIVHCHNDNATSLFKRISHYFFKQFNNNYATSYISCSESAGKWLYKRNILKSSNYQVIYNGIDTKAFLFDENLRKKYRDEFNVDENTLLLMHVGRFNKQKNQKQVVDIFKKVHDLNKNSKLVFFGTGSKKIMNEIKNKINEYKLNDAIVIHQPIININEYYNAFDCFIMPSFYEGYGLAFLEAQINGLYCVVSNTIPKAVEISPISTMLSIDIDNENWAFEILKTKIGKHLDLSKIIDIDEYDYKKQADKIIKLYKK